MKSNQDSHITSQLITPTPNSIQSQIASSKRKKQSSKEKNENSMNDLRDKMQSMHDKLKDGQKVNIVLGGDHGVENSSYRMLDINNTTQQQFDMSQLEPERLKSYIKSIKSDKQILHPSLKLLDQSYQVDKYHQRSIDQSNYLNESYKHDSIQNSFGPEGQSLCANHPLQEPNKVNIMKIQNDQMESFQQEQPYQDQNINNKSEVSEDSGTQASKQKIMLNTVKQSVNIENQNDTGFIDSLKNHCKMIQQNQNQINPQQKLLQKKDNFCNKLLKFFRLKREQYEFGKGIDILDHIAKNQINNNNRQKQKVLQFINAIQSRQHKRSANILKQDDFQLINDVSYIYLDNQQTRFQNFSLFQKIYTRILQFTKKFVSSINDLLPPFNLFMPTDTPVVIWDVSQIVITYGFLFLYSIQVFFAQVLFSFYYMIEFFMFIIVFIISDILIRFNTCYFEKDQIIKSRYNIAIKYLTSLVFLTDIISLSAIFFKLKYEHGEIAYNPDHELSTYFFNCLIFLLGNRLKEKRKRFDTTITLNENQKHIFRLFKQLFNVLTVAHLGKNYIIQRRSNFNLNLLKKASIAWHMLGIYEERQNYPVSWKQKAGIKESHYFEQYIYSIYWAITTMTTVGYGDITATNSTEALFISVMMILFSCVFAYSINNIGFILSEIEKSSKKLNDNLSIIQRYLSRKNVDISLKSRVRHYLSFLAEESKNRDKEAEDEIIGILSKKLRDEITLQINTKILNRFHLFSSNFSSKIMKQIVFIMEEVLVSPNEVIFQEDDVGDQAIYFIQSGIVEIFSNKLTKQDGSCVVFQQLSTNQLFGEISFFSGLSRKASARSVNLSTMYKIKREKFIELLKANEEDFERLKMMQEQIIFQQNLKCLYLQCYCCKQLGHIASNCFKINPNFDKQFIILKKNFSRIQDRNKYARLGRKVSNSKLLLKKNQNICKKIKEVCRNYNTQTMLLYADHSEDKETYWNDEGQNSLCSSDQSFQSDCYKPTISKMKSAHTNTFKNQETENFLLNARTHTLSKSKTIDDAAISNHRQKREKKRLSSVEQQNQPISNQQISHFSLFQDNISHHDIRKQTINIAHPLVYGSEENISSIQKYQYQDLMSKFHNNMQLSIDFDLSPPFNQYIGSKQNIDLNPNTVNIQGASLNDQKRYLNMIKDQFQKKLQLKSGESELPSPTKHTKKIMSNNLIQNNMHHDEFNSYNMKEKEKQELSDILIHNKQLSNKFINATEEQDKSKFAYFKQHQYSQQISQMSQIQQFMPSQNKVFKQNSTMNDKAEIKQRQQTRDIDLEAMMRINQLNQILQQNQQDLNFFKYQLVCLELFDKVKEYKKFFPHNNIEKVLFTLRKLQNEKRQQKRITQKSKRRSNVKLKLDSKSNQLFAFSSQYKPFQEDIPINKPTYLSYGVHVRNQSIFPKQFI